MFLLQAMEEGKVIYLTFLLIQTHPIDVGMVRLRCVAWISDCCFTI